MEPGNAVTAVLVDKSDVVTVEVGIEDDLDGCAAAEPTAPSSAGIGSTVWARFGPMSNRLLDTGRAVADLVLDLGGWRRTADVVQCVHFVAQYLSVVD
jgi:hypothetical protein